MHQGLRFCNINSALQMVLPIGALIQRSVLYHGVVDITQHKEIHQLGERRTSNRVREIRLEILAAELGLCSLLCLVSSVMSPEV